MSDQRVPRRLAAIMAADVVGYSRLMEADEAGTRARMRSLHAELIDPRIAADGGRIVKTTGDGILVEFASAVDAVKNALEIQSAMATYNAELPEAEWLVFRVGVNLGDVIIEGDDIHGDGVNVAARLEGLCAPGEVYVSGTVRDHVEGKLKAAFDDLGEQSVKNIARPVPVFRAREESAEATSNGRAAAPPPPSDKPSIAVLPFDNLSGDPEQEYFSDGIAEDIITGLSHVRTFLVIARNSTFSYKGTSPDIRDVARDLGVRYVLEGSVRKAGNRVRITAQLIDAATGAHLWADRYDREMEDIFAVQDEITQTVVGAIEPELSRAEQQRALMKPPESLDAWDLYSRGLWNFARPDPEHNREAQALFARATELDPNFCAAHAYLVFAKFLSVIFGFAEDRAATVEEMMVIGKNALAADGGDAFAHFAIAGAHLITVDTGPAIAALERASALNPSFALAHHWLGDAYGLAGETDKAIACEDTAMRLSPADPHTYGFTMVSGLACFVARRFDEAENWMRKSTRQPSPPPMSYVLLLACLGMAGRRSEVPGVFEEFEKKFPDYDIETFFSSSRWVQSPERAEIFREGLRKAGVLET